MDYMVTILRTEQNEKSNHFPKDSGKRYQFLNINKPMSFEGFEALSIDERKRQLKIFLGQITRKQIKSSKEFERTERVIVNPKGDYGLDNTVFDKEIKIPKHLRKPLSVKNQ